ncbi:hypothetical protein AgCh_006058 [Apium graveolens]
MKTRDLDKPNSLIENSETSTSQINYGVLEISISQYTYRDVKFSIDQMEISRMEDEYFHIRFYHMGKFQNTKYVGGEQSVILGVDPDRFSNTVLMEHVKDDLKYCEVGGIYIRNNDEPARWKLVAGDMDLPNLDKEMKKGDFMEFYIDNIVDTKFELLK